MKIRTAYIFPFIFGMILTVSSCVKDVDFGQLEEVQFTPVVVLDFLYSEFDVEEQIPGNLPSGTEFTISQPIRDTINYDLISSNFAVENLDRVELFIEIDNQIERGFILQFQFLLEEGKPIGTFYTMSVQPGNGENFPGVVSRYVPDPIVLDNATLRQLQDARKIYVELIIPTLNTDLRGLLTLKSKGVYYVKYTP